MLELTAKSLILTLKEFFIVWADQILYYNQIYNPEIFDQIKAFNLFVYKNRNPSLDSYFNNLFDKFLSNVLINKDRKDAEFKKGYSGLSQIIVVLYNTKSQKIKRKYAIQFNDLLINLGDTLDNLANDSLDNSSKIKVQNMTWEEVFTQFNSILFNHINELKRTYESDAKKRQDYESILGSSRGNEIFFKVMVEIDSSVNLVMHDWVKLNEHSTNNPMTKVTSIGEVNLEVINLGIYNEYMS